MTSPDPLEYHSLSRPVRRLVVEGCGQWAMKYLAALKAATLARRPGPKIDVIFTFDSTFGLDRHAGRLPAQFLARSLTDTLKNVEMVKQAGFACVDVKDAYYALPDRGPRYAGRALLPDDVDVVFVVTTDRTHCDVAEYWLGKAACIFVEKPFDVSTARIKDFRNSYKPYKSMTKVFAFDHYFLRCNQAARDSAFFLRHILGQTSRATRRAGLTEFEFRMTEPPCYDDRGKYDNRPLGSRILSVQEGMIFDMGAHALPILEPFLDIWTLEVQDVWAGVSEGMRSILFDGAESFSVAQVTANTRPEAGTTKRRISGSLEIGKDLGGRPEKYLRLGGSFGSILFDLTTYRVYQKQAGKLEPITFLPPDWEDFLIDEVLAGRIPRAVTRMDVDAAEAVVGRLEQWRAPLRKQARGSLRSYRPGTRIEELRRTSDYQVK